MSSPFEVANPCATDPDAFDRNVTRPARIAELNDRIAGLEARAGGPAIELGERAALKREAQALRRRVAELDAGPRHGR